MEVPNCIKIILTFVFFSLIANMKSNGKTKDGKPKKGKEGKQKGKGTVHFI